MELLELLEIAGADGSEGAEIADCMKRNSSTSIRTARIMGFLIGYLLVCIRIVVGIRILGFVFRCFMLGLRGFYPVSR